MREPTEQDYNAESRAIEFRVDIFFNGLSNEPLAITRDNYLIDLSFLDEACADGDTFIGKPSANELSFTMYSESGMFNPVNPTGAYYRKIKVGVPVKLFCRPVVEGTAVEISQEEVAAYTHAELSEITHEEIQMLGSEDKVFSWDELGTFYVSDWTTDITGITADVTVVDSLYKLLNGNKVKLSVIPNYNMLSLVQDFFRANGFAITTKGEFTQILPYAYVNEENSKFIDDISMGSLSFIFVNHKGELVIQSIDSKAGVDWELTDHDQIISISAQQSVVNAYSGVSVTMQKTQISAEMSLLSNNAQAISGKQKVRLSNQGLTKTPLYALSHSEIESGADCRLVDIDASVFDVSYEIENLTDSETTVAINLFGHVLELIPTTFSDDGDDLLKVDNIYIQTEEYATHIRDLLKKYISLSVPFLELNIRGNPKYQVGDKVHIVSENYNVDFTGWLIRQEYKYDGGLSASIKVLNSAIIGG